MFYKLDEAEGRLPINAAIKFAYVTNQGKGYLLIDDEYSKKVQTNALTKGLSTLGFNSDVFEGKFDDDKYIQQMKEEFYFIDMEQIKVINDLIKDRSVDKARFLQFIKAESVEKILRTDYGKAVAGLEKKEKKND